MDLFDANCLLGRRAIHTPLGTPTTPEALLAEMDRLGISEALVTHAMAVDGYPPEGNERLMREIATHPRLHPCWVLLPTTGELPRPTELVSRMRAQGVRAARMLPTRHRYLFTEANVGDLLAALETARIPVFVDFGIGHWGEGTTDWRSLDDLCSRYPRLPFVVVGESIGAPRYLFPLWQRHENLLLETSYYQVHQGLSEVARRFGAQRLLFGTGMPVRAPGPALALLRYDFLSDSDRAAIGGGNLRARLSHAHVGAYHATARSPRDYAPTADAAHDSEQGANPTDLPDHPILDAHGHLGGWFSSYVHAGDAEGLVASMDRLAIQALALSAFDAIGPDMRGGNDRVAAAMQAHPGRFLGYAVVDPNEPEAMVPELERCFERHGFHAIKIHADTHGYPAAGENYRPALQYADAHRLCVLVHGAITEEMLESYPKARFLSAHVGGWDGRFPNQMVEWTRRYPNLYLDLASSVICNGALERLVAEAGADRVVHGSDAPLMDPGYQLGRVLAARLSPLEKRLILHDNAARLLLGSRGSDRR